MSIYLKVQIIYHPFFYVSSFWYRSTVISFLAFDPTDVNVLAADGRLLLSTTSLAMSCAVYVCVWDKKKIKVLQVLEDVTCVYRMKT